MVMFQLLVTSFVCLLISRGKTEPIQKLLLFIIVQTIAASCFVGLSDLPPFDYYLIVNLIHVSTFLFISNYKCTIYEKWTSYSILSFLVTDTLITYFNFWFSGLWINHVSIFKSDIFMVWLIAIVIGDSDKQKEYWYKVIFVFIVWWLSGLVTYT